MINQKALKIGIQKNGRLSEKSLELFRNIGFEFDIQNRKLFATSQNGEIELLFLRNSDIATMLDQSICDLAILGENTLEEKHIQHIPLLPLGFGKCRLSIAGKKEF